MSKTIKLGDYLGSDMEEEFYQFDLTEVQEVLGRLADVEAIDLAHAEYLQQQSLRGADILIEYMGKIVKTVGYLESKVNTIKNKVSLEFQAPGGVKTTTDMKIWAAGASTEVEDIQIQLAKARASKMVLDKKYDLMIKLHHHCKDVAMGMRKGVLGYNNLSEKSEIPEGY